MNSLYEYIASSVVNGKLPDDFSLPELPGGDNQIKWADGALDGVIIYHAGALETGEEELALISDAVEAAAAGDYERADRLFGMLGEKTRAISVIDSLQSYVIDKKQALNAGNLYGYAKHLLLVTDNRECMKLSLSLLELFKTDADEELKEKIRTVGLSEEFVLFAMRVMRHWKTGNGEI